MTTNLIPAERKCYTFSYQPITPLLSILPEEEPVTLRLIHMAYDSNHIEKVLVYYNKSIGAQNSTFDGDDDVIMIQKVNHVIREKNYLASTPDCPLTCIPIAFRMDLMSDTSMGDV